MNPTAGNSHPAGSYFLQLPTLDICDLIAVCSQEPEACSIQQAERKVCWFSAICLFSFPLSIGRFQVIMLISKWFLVQPYSEQLQEKVSFPFVCLEELHVASCH